MAEFIITKDGTTINNEDKKQSQRRKNVKIYSVL